MGAGIQGLAGRIKGRSLELRGVSRVGRSARARHRLSRVIKIRVVGQLGWVRVCYTARMEWLSRWEVMCSKRPLAPCRHGDHLVLK